MGDNDVARSKREKSFTQKLLTLIIEIAVVLVLLAVVAPQYFFPVLQVFGALFGLH
jgi:hypothetical protein